MGNELGFWIFDYAPEHELQVRAYLNFLPSLMARQHPDIKMAQVNLLEVLKDYLAERGFLDKAIAMQKSKGDAALLKALRGPLHMGKFAPYLLRHSLSHGPDIVLLSGVGSLWPMVRAHSLLNALHGPLGHKPLVLFYPVMIVLVGINAMSVIILATIMAAIPMALNTAVGLNQMPPVYLKLARSLRTSPRQTLFAIAIPAAGPFIVAGLRLAVVYALIGTIAMEFTTAQAGLGYRIRYLYEIFDNIGMFAYIVVVLVLSCLLTVALAAVGRVLLRGRNS